MSCHCGLSQDFKDCCEPYILGNKKPETAEELMRSRYSAYAVVNMQYIENTHDPKTRDDNDMKANQDWASKADWQGLKIVKTEAGLTENEVGLVEFIAKYDLGEGSVEHHEVSEFVKKNGRWYFSKGKNPKLETVLRDVNKVGRNDPCPCGSGRKYKKCCVS